MKNNHKTKLLLGFDKQLRRQNNKPREKQILLPTSINLPKNFKGEYKHYMIVYNSIWNGMNLIQLINKLIINKVGGMYGKFAINKDGKYILSNYGKRILNKKRNKLS